MLPSTRQPLALVGEGSPSAPAWGCSSLPSHSSMTWKEVRGEGRLGPGLVLLGHVTLAHPQSGPVLVPVNA